MSDYKPTDAGRSQSDVLSSLKDKATDAVQEMKDKATDVTGISADTMKDHANKAIESAKELASETGEKLSDTINEQKNASADYAKTFADTLRRAAGEFDQQIPLAGQYIRSAAEQVDAVSNSVRNGNVGDLLKGAQDFARRQPTAFLGLTALAGFALVRFLKSSDRASGSTSSQAEIDDRKGAA